MKKYQTQMAAVCKKTVTIFAENEMEAAQNESKCSEDTIDPECKDIEWA